MPISAVNKKIAKQVALAFGGKPVVREFVHDHVGLKIDLLYSDDQYNSDLRSICTLGLSDYAFPWGNSEFPTRLEICALAPADSELFLNLVASAAFKMIRSKTIATPGAVLKGYASEYFPDTELRNLYFTAPFIWENSLSVTVFETKTVSWLLCFPISDVEANFVEEYGNDEFESILEEANIEIHDLNRRSII